MLRALVQAAGVANFAYAIYFELVLLDMPDDISPTRRKFGGMWKYLTFWNLWLQLGYFCVSLAVTLSGGDNAPRHASSASSPSKRKEEQVGLVSRLQRLRDDFFASVAFPIGMVGQFGITVL